MCDDLGDEWADFIGINGSHQPKTISFYHAKYGDPSANWSTHALSLQYHCQGADSIPICLVKTHTEDREALPNELELQEWREALRQEYVRHCRAGDGNNHWPDAEYPIRRKWFERFVVTWRARHGRDPRPWEILIARSRIFNKNPQTELRDAEQACRACGIDPRTTTLACNRYYRYLILN